MACSSMVSTILRAKRSMACAWLALRRGTPVELVKRWDSPGFEDGATCASTGPPDQRSCVRHVAAGAQSSFFRVESGDVFAAGVNVANQLGGSWDDSGGQLIVPKKLHDLADDAGSVPLALPVAQLASAGSHTVFLSAECSNAPSPCHAAGTAACVDIQTEATAPAFSFGAPPSSGKMSTASAVPANSSGQQPRRPCAWLCSATAGVGRAWSSCASGWSLEMPSSPWVVVPARQRPSGVGKGGEAMQSMSLGVSSN